MGAGGDGLLDNDSAQDFISELVRGIEQDVIEIHEMESRKLAGRLSAAVGILLRLAYSFPASESAIQKYVGYYLADRLIGDGDQEALRQVSIDAVTQKIFQQELTEAGVDESFWPDTTDVTLLRKFFNIVVLLLIADFGKEPVKNTEIGRAHV